MASDSKSSSEGDLSFNSGTGNADQPWNLWAGNDWPPLPPLNEPGETFHDSETPMSMWDEMVSFAEREQQHHNDDGMDDINMEEPAANTLPASTFEVFLQIMEGALFRTNVVLVSFIPEQIQLEEFITLMEHILTQLLGEAATSATVLRFLRSAQGPTFFGVSHPRWMELHHPAERHASFLLRMDHEVSFAPFGWLEDSIKPRAFQVSPLQRGRNYLVQAVPHDFKARFLQGPSLAVWRGLGSNLHAGFPATAQCLATAYTRLLFANQDVDLFHVLSYHQANATLGTPPIGQGHYDKPMGLKQTGRGSHRGRTNNPPRAPKGSKKTWMEFYILTFCSAPAGRIPDLFTAFLPRDAHPRTPTVVLNLFGWQCEVGRELKAFRDGVIKPDPSLLTPLSVTVFPNIPQRHTLRDLCARLSTDGQDLSTAKLAFLQHDPRGTMALYLTDGNTRYQPTAAFLRLTTTTTHENPDIPGLAGVRECYRLMGPPTGALSLRHGGAAHKTATRTPATPPPQHSSYATAVARVPPGLEETMTQLSARREPMLLDRANTLIVQHLRPLEQKIEQQETTIRRLQDKLTRTSEQTSKAQNAAASALNLLTRQNQSIQQLRRRADEDRQQSQREQEEALIFQRDMEEALQSLGLPPRATPRTQQERAHPPAPMAQDEASAMHEE